MIPALSNFLKNHSRWIIGIALALIAIGAALAVYSGFQSEPPAEDTSGDKASDSPKPESPTPQDKSKEGDQTRVNKKPRRSRRKTRW